MNSKNLLNLILAVLLFLLFALACSSSTTKQTTSSTSGTPSPSASATQAAGSDDTEKDVENEKLKKKVEELEKKVDQQQKTPPVKRTAPPTQSSATMAQVNSPGDGFLALRSEPGSDVGYRIIQIPHGSYVQVLGCQGFAERVGGRSGRWCRINYGGYTGWAFDGWLVY